MVVPARLAISSWQDCIPLKVLPVGINYQSFTSLGKNIVMNFGNIIQQNDIEFENGFGKSIYSFNKQLQNKLQPLVLEINKNNIRVLKQKLGVKVSFEKKILLSIPALAGYIFHWPLYFFVQKFTWKRASHNDHYDSILVGLLFGIYPLYLILISVMLLPIPSVCTVFYY